MHLPRLRHDRSAQPPIVQSVTSAPVSRHDEQSYRMHRYLLTMGIRTACFILAVVTAGWLRWTFVAFAAVLPYIAVVMANAVRPRSVVAPAPVLPQVDPTHRLER